MGLTPALTMADMLREIGSLQRRMLREMLGDRLIGSPYVERGTAIAIAVDIDRPVQRVAGHVEQAAEILKAGGMLVVSKEWLDADE